MKLAMQICAKEQQYGEFLSIFDSLSPQVRVALREDPHALMLVGIAAIKLRRDDVITQLLGEAIPETEGGLRGGRVSGTLLLSCRLGVECSGSWGRVNAARKGRTRGLSPWSGRASTVHIKSFHIPPLCPPSERLSLPATWNGLADLCGACLDAYEDDANNETGTLVLESGVASRIVSLLYQAGDKVNLVRLLVIAQERGVLLQTGSFRLASQFLLHCDQPELVLEMLYKYLEQIDAEGGHSNPKRRWRE